MSKEVIKVFQNYEKTLSFLPDSAKNHYLCTD